MDDACGPCVMDPDSAGLEVLEASGELRWHVLHTLARQEKALALDLRRRGIGHYLPLVRQVRYRGSRRLASDLPLFPGYLFLLGTLEQAYVADRTRRVASIVPVPDQDKLNWELRNLQMALRSRPALEFFPGLRAGVRVEVRSGPFEGLQGVIEQRLAGKNRLLLQVSMLGKAVALEIDGSLLDPLD